MKSLPNHVKNLLISEEFEASMVPRCTPKYRRRYVVDQVPAEFLAKI